MARATRLLELLIRLRAAPSVTAQELADHFEVSRRTMLRDLRALTDLGVPLVATPGPGGGYALASDQRLVPLALTAGEALGLLMSYEAFLRYAQSPFSGESRSAVTKIRATLPSDVARELERMHRHVAIVARPLGDLAPLLGELLQAALDAAHLRIVYHSRSGISERVIFPFGLYAADGCWYCACHDERRDAHLSLRADRVLSLARVSGRARPPHIPVDRWLETVERDDGLGLPLRITVTPRGVRSLAMRALFARILPAGQGGGTIKGTIPASEIEWYATQLLPVGADALVQSPPELIAAIRRQVLAIANLYPEPCDGPSRDAPSPVRIDPAQTLKREQSGTAHTSLSVSGAGVSHQCLPTPRLAPVTSVTLPRRLAIASLLTGTLGAVGERCKR